MTQTTTKSFYNPEKYSLIKLAGKRPIEKGWEQHCTEKRDAKEVQQRNGYNLGIACGPASNLLVLDIDDVDAFTKVCAEKDWDVPETLTIQTGSGGLHHYYNYPSVDDDQQYRNRSLKDEGFDIRGLGGLVVAPGSTHPKTRRKYEIISDVPQVDAPEWLIDLSVATEEVESNVPAICRDVVDIEKFDLGARALAYINDGVVEGSRSDAIWHVLLALVEAEVSDDGIYSIFDEYPIGEKYLEKPNPEEWLRPQIDKARQVKPVGSKFIIECIEKSERGDAELYARLAKGKFCYDHTAGCWFVFNGTTWEKDVKGQALKHVDKIVDTYLEESTRQSKLRREALSSSDSNGAERKAKALEDALLTRYRKLNKLQRRMNVLKLATTESIGIRGTEWDSCPWSLGCSNGVIDLKTGKLKDVSADDYIKTASPVKWIGLDASAPTWDAFIRGIFNDNAELVAYIQRLFGCALIGRTLEHVLPIFWGQGRNGKSTLFNVLKLVLGELTSPIPSESILSQKFSQSGASHSADLFLLKGRRLVWTSEVTDNRYFETSVVKRLTGGDELVGRRPHATDFETFFPSHMLCLLTNAKPRIPNASDYALFQRLHLIPFEVSFVADPKEAFEKKADPELESKLKDEASGILAWLVRGCLLYQEEGLNPPAVVQDATKEYQSEEDSFGHFLEECCEAVADARAVKGVVYKTYQKWCGDNGHHPLNSTNFYKKMKERYKEMKSGNNRYFVGLALQEDSAGGDTLFPNNDDF